ncbi:hypothetical protein HanPI659440_Chr07g0269331 [Helianthus annuus]|nr:hypothetical protein HanPI659440_Chr07g0269331 [Helianthus annuus]
MESTFQFYQDFVSFCEMNTTLGFGLFDLANREAVDESAEWRLRFDEAEERANTCANELKSVKANLGDDSMTKRLDMLQKENMNLLERVETLKQELEAEKLKCSTQKS